MTTDETGLVLLRSELLLPLTELRGDVRLILQRMDQQDARAQEHRQALAALDGRVDSMERTAVTREEMEQRETRMRAELDERARRKLTILGLVLTGVFGALSAVMTVIAIIAN